jgi:hypothetical protein
MNDDKDKPLEERAKQLDRAYLDKVADAVKLNTRGASMHRLEESKVRCPLCRGRFEKMADLRKVLQPREVLVCHRCKIGCDVKDPWIGRWELPGARAIPCPRCEMPMRFFATSTGFWRAECWATLGTGKKGKRRCGTTLAQAQPDRKPGMYVPGSSVDRPVATPDNPEGLVLPDAPEGHA